MRVKKVHMILPILLLTLVLVFLLIRINQLENRVSVLESDIDHKNTALDDVNATLDSLQNKLDTIEAGSKLSQKYIGIISERFSESEFKGLLDSLQENSLVALQAHLESLKIYVHVLEETLKYSEGIEIKYASELLAVSEADGHRKLELRNYNSNALESVELSDDCEFYLGSQFYRHNTTLDNLITPGEPLEAGVFTLVCVDGVVKYIFTGRTYF
ncbi:hypothetical protein [Fusibacter ferrireducens]|uniref:Uncharacterized protein n=1 Tax=Fusibacter ferrireducens TaxID=2785058 RepID=A0ABR9ZTI3_9FIRM|nr:hypothetical protein [Fusibacter ferrireducens]MBF4693762.1 hypothetical protein [Fusibacter ferrireducens]